MCIRDREKSGYIVRSFHPSDGRRKVIRLTESGRAYISELLVQLNQAQMRAYALLTVAEQKQLNYLMERDVYKRQGQRRICGNALFAHLL